MSQVNRNVSLLNIKSMMKIELTLFFFYPLMNTIISMNTIVFECIYYIHSRLRFLIQAIFWGKKSRSPVRRHRYIWALSVNGPNDINYL